MTRPPTKFEQAVYTWVRGIPAGRVVTYATLAQALECGSAQAVGQALKRNPYAPDVPCHRVIKADLSLGGYVGATKGPKLIQKRKLLQQEGVEFDESGRLLDERQLYHKLAEGTADLA